MNKAEFLRELEKRLHVLNDKERRDVLEEYAQHIDLKIESGLSEEEAVKDFGSPEELSAELLDAYCVNAEYAAGDVSSDEGKGKRAYKTVQKAVSGTAEKAGHAAQSAGKAAKSAGRAAERAGAGLLRMVKRFFLFWWNLICGAWNRVTRMFRREERMERKMEQNNGQNNEQTNGRQGTSLLRRFWNGCVRCVKFCALIFLNAMLLGFAVPFLMCGLCFLFFLGVLVVLLAQGYPVIGAAVASFGMVLCSLGAVGILLSWVFPGKRKRHSKRGEESK